VDCYGSPSSPLVGVQEGLASAFCTRPLSLFYWFRTPRLCSLMAGQTVLCSPLSLSAFRKRISYCSFSRHCSVPLGCEKLRNLDARLRSHPPLTMFSIFFSPPRLCSSQLKGVLSTPGHETIWPFFCSGTNFEILAAPLPWNVFSQSDCPSAVPIQSTAL